MLSSLDHKPAWSIFDIVRELRRRGITKEHIEKILKTAQDPKRW